MKDYAGATTLATILPGAVFGPVLSTDNVGTARVIGRLLQGRMPGIPRLAFEIAIWLMCIFGR
jgi:dihydroflavonol-4-reductase